MTMLMLFNPLPHSLFTSFTFLTSSGTCFIGWFLLLVVNWKVEGDILEMKWNFYLEMVWKIYLEMEYNIVFCMTGDIILETTIFGFYSDSPFPFWWWCYEPPLLRNLLLFYREIYSCLYKIYVLKAVRIYMVYLFNSFTHVI